MRSWLGLLGASGAVAGCFGPAVDRIKDPVEKARHNCRYHLERSLARAERPQALDPDGVLRKDVATFGKPEIVRTGTLVRFTWSRGAIRLRDSAAAHSGACTMDLAGGQQLVVSATLDGHALHSGFRF